MIPKYKKLEQKEVNFCTWIFRGEKGIDYEQERKACHMDPESENEIHLRIKKLRMEKEEGQVWVGTYTIKCRNISDLLGIMFLEEC